MHFFPNLNQHRDINTCIASKNENRTISLWPCYLCQKNYCSISGLLTRFYARTDVQKRVHKFPFLLECHPFIQPLLQIVLNRLLFWYSLFVHLREICFRSVVSSSAVLTRFMQCRFGVLASIFSQGVVNLEKALLVAFKERKRFDVNGGLFYAVIEVGQSRQYWSQAGLVFLAKISSIPSASL